MASTALSYLLLFSCMFFVANSQVFSWGKCKKNVPVKPDFDLDSYLGRWYEIQSFPASFQKGSKCVTATYSMKDNGKIKVDNKGIKEKTGELDGAIGEAYSPNPETYPAKLKVKFSWWQPGGNYWVLDTDYESYSVVYSCSNFVFFKMEYAWILSRHRSINGDTRMMLLNNMEAVGIDTSPFNISNQSGCELIDEA